MFISADYEASPIWKAWCHFLYTDCFVHQTQFGLTVQTAILFVHFNETSKLENIGDR